MRLRLSSSLHLGTYVHLFADYVYISETLDD